MPANLTIYVGTINSTGFRVPLVNAKVYLRPNRTDITYLNGTTICHGRSNQTSDPGYRDCWVAVTNGTGFDIPERAVHRHRDAPPEASNHGRFHWAGNRWQLINPNGPSTNGSASTVIYTGKLLSTMVLPSPVNVPDDVMSLSVDAWRCTSLGVHGQPDWRRRANWKADVRRGVTQQSITLHHRTLRRPR